MADGDGRAALTLAEEVWRAARAGRGLRRRPRCSEIIQRRAPIYDKAQDGHYNLISALHKSVRGSDPDAALYYLARMLDAGEEPLFIAPPPGAHGGRGHRPRRSAGAGASPSPPRTPIDYLGSPGGRAGARAGRCLSRHRAEIERRLHRLQGGDAAPPRRAARCRRPSTSSTRRPS